MNKLFLLGLVLTLAIACGKKDEDAGNGGDLIGNFENDICAEAGACTNKFEITPQNYNSPRAQRSVNREKKYFIGRTYESSIVELLNEYDFENDRYINNCVVSYDEKQTLYRVKKKYDDEDEEFYDEITYKYVRSNFKIVTETQECLEFINDRYRDRSDSEGWETFGLYFSDEVDVEILLAYLQDHRLYLLDYKGRPAIRLETKGVIDKTIGEFNPDTFEFEEIPVKEKSALMQYQDDTYIINLFKYNNSKHGDNEARNDSHILKKVYQSDIDPNDIPDDLDDKEINIYPKQSLL